MNSGLAVFRREQATVIFNNYNLSLWEPENAINVETCYSYVTHNLHTNIANAGKQHL